MVVLRGCARALGHPVVHPFPHILRWQGPLGLMARFEHRQVLVSPKCASHTPFLPAIIAT